MATDSGHNSKSQTHSGLPKCDSRPVVSAKWSLHSEVVNLIFRLWGTPVVDIFATVHNTHLPQFMSLVPEPRALALSQAWQGRSMYMFPAFPLINKVIQKLRTTQTGEVILIAPLVALTTVVSTPLTTECGSPTILSVLQRPVVTTGLYLKWQVIPSARMGALMQHNQEAGFSREVSKLAAAPVGNPPQKEYTTTGGYTSLTGPQGEDLIHICSNNHFSV